MTEMFGLVMPERVAEAVVRRDVSATYDPVTGDLMQIIMPFMSRSEVMTVTFDKGWETEASVEDTACCRACTGQSSGSKGATGWRARSSGISAAGAPDSRSTPATSSGGETRADGDRKSVLEARQRHCARAIAAPDAEMRAAGLEGRWFIGIGNHEVWGDPRIDGVLSTVPYLRPLGVTPDRLIYKFDFKFPVHLPLERQNDYRSPSGWDSDRPVYAEQARQMGQWLDEAKALGLRRAFITFHYPVFSRSGFGGIPAPDNPHRAIASYARDMEIAVFNGHIHTTEMYDVDGVKYLLLGGGGAEQDPILPGRTAIRCRRTTRPTSIGGASHPKRSTTTAWWTSNPAKRPGSHLIACAPGRPSRSAP